MVQAVGTQVRPMPGGRNSQCRSLDDDDRPAGSPRRQASTTRPAAATAHAPGDTIGTYSPRTRAAAPQAGRRRTGSCKPPASTRRPPPRSRGDTFPAARRSRSNSTSEAARSATGSSPRFPPTRRWTPPHRPRTPTRSRAAASRLRASSAPARRWGGSWCSGCSDAVRWGSSTRWRIRCSTGASPSS